MPDEKTGTWEDLVDAAINCALGVLENDKTATPEQVTIAAAVIRTQGPAPLGLDEYIAGLQANTAATLNVLKSGAGFPEGLMAPPKGR